MRSYGQGPYGSAWVLVVRALLGPPGLSWAGPLWAGPLWAPLDLYEPGLYGPPWALMGQAGPYGLPLMGSALMAPRGLMGRALMGPLGPCGHSIEFDQSYGFSKLVCLVEFGSSNL